MTIAIFASPAFWRGAALARAELMRRYGGRADRLSYHAAIARHEAVADALNAGTPLEEIPAWRHWLRSVHVKQAGGPDPLSIARPGRGR